MQKIKILGWLVAFNLCICLQAIAQEAPATPATADIPDPASDRATEFVAVTGAEEEGVPGGTLLIVAYACLWLLPFAFILRMARSQAKVANEIAALKNQMN